MKNQSKRGKQTNTLRFIVDVDTELLPFLLKALSDRSRNSVKSILTRGQVTVNDHVETQHNYALKTGQTVSVLKNKAAIKQEALIGLSIMHEDNDIIVIQKEAGLLSIASNKEKTQTVHKQLMNYVRREDPEKRVFVVHRLDKDTSGLMIFAKHEQAKRILQDNWSKRVKERTYVALVEGKVPEKEGTITSWLKENKAHRMYSSEDKKAGAYAETTYRLIKQNNDFSLLKIELKTGRKNQIRVHLQDLGYPVVGDKKYGSKINPIRRLGLHSSVLGFTHPSTNEYVRFQSEPPASFANKVK